MSEQPPELLKDEELCSLLRISRATLHRHLKEGPPRRQKAVQSDIRDIRHLNVGGERRWLRSSVMAFLQGQPTKED